MLPIVRRSSCFARSLSSALIVTDDTGRLARTLDYYPYGAPRVNTIAGINITEYTATTTPSNPYSLDLESSSLQYAYNTTTSVSREETYQYPPGSN